MKKKLFKFKNQRLQVQWNEQVATEPVEMMIYDAIGKDPWDGTGMSAADFKNALSQVPRDRDLNLRVNSKGGDVHEGMAMMNALNEWPNKVTAIIDGVAASTASWMILAADEVKAYKNSQVFIHDAIACGYGNAEDLRNTADKLDTTSNQIAGMYADKTGESTEEMRQMMKDETLMTGEEAEDLGLVDTIVDGTATRNFASDELAKMKNTLSKFYNDSARKKQGDNQPQTEINIMNKAAMIALLNKWGVTIPENASDDQLLKLVEAGPITNKLENKTPVVAPEVLEMQNQIKELKELNNAALNLRITNEIDLLVKNDQLTENERKAAVARCQKDITYLDELKARPSRPPGAEPLNIDPEVKADASPKDTLVALNRFNEPMNAWKRGGNVSMQNIRDAAVNKAVFWAKNQAKLMPLMLNTNTVDASLKRSVILQISIRDFVRRLLALRAFSTVFESVPLEGTNKVEVPFYDLDSSASTSWAAGSGYNTAGNTTTAKREITVGSGQGGAGTGGDRLYQGLAFTSEEIARQPFLKILELAQLKVEKLASDVVTDVLSVITFANFGAAGKITPAAAFSSDDVADLKLACKLWPEMGRSLIMDSAYDANLLKDPSIKFALNAGSDAAIKEGRVGPRLMGFDYMEIPTIPANGENLTGFAAFKSAVLVATAPVPPVEEVRNAGTTYEIVVDPQTGIAFEYRSFGDNTLDTGKHFVECSYGFAKGNGNALKRVVSAGQ